MAQVTPANKLSPMDRMLIMELYAKASWMMDCGNTEAFLECFAPDALAYGAHGHAAIRAWHERFLKDTAFPGSQHFVGQFRITPDGAEGATVRAYVCRMYRVPDTTAAGPIWLGYYSDKVAKRDGRWVLVERVPHNADEQISRRFGSEPSVPVNTIAAELFDLGAAIR